MRYYYLCKDYLWRDIRGYYISANVYGDSTFNKRIDFVYMLNYCNQIHPNSVMELPESCAKKLLKGQDKAHWNVPWPEKQ